MVTLHDFFITCPNGGLYDHGREEICLRSPLSLSCVTCDCDRRHYAHKLWRVARGALQNGWLDLPRRVSAFLGVSEFSLALIRPHLSAIATAAVLRNPVDAVDLGPAEPARERAFVYVGRFVPEKGVLLFAEAVRSTGLPAVFVGDGALGPELRRLCPDARFTGWLGPAQIRAELRGARALVFPPTWYETLGLVAVEAASVGIPVVVSDGCAASEVVIDTHTGLHFTHGSADSLATRMRDLAADDALVASLGRAAYDWYWSDPWTTEAHVNELVGHYARVLKQKEIADAAQATAQRFTLTAANPP